METRIAEVWDSGRWVRVGFDSLKEESLFRVVEVDGTLMMEGRVYIAGGRSYLDAKGCRAVICKPDGFVIRNVSHGSEPLRAV